MLAFVLKRKFLKSRKFHEIKLKTWSHPKWLQLDDFWGLRTSEAWGLLRLEDFWGLRTSETWWLWRFFFLFFSQKILNWIDSSSGLSLLYTLILLEVTQYYFPALWLVRIRLRNTFSPIDQYCWGKPFMIAQYWETNERTIPYVIGKLFLIAQ